MDSERLKNHSQNIFILLLILVVGYFAYISFMIHLNAGPIWDTFDLLANAALFAGKDIGYSDLLRPPLIPILTSLFFRVYDLSIWPIMLIDGFIFVLGSIGLYFLFKLSFDDLTSFLGVLIFSTFFPVLMFAAAGLTDVPSVCISILAILFTVLAVKKDSRFFYIAFPLAMLAFLTRFTSALLIFPIFLYILINLREIKRLNDVLIGCLLSFLVIIPVFWFFAVTLGDPLYPFLNFFDSSSASVSGVSSSDLNIAYNPDILYYLKLIPSYMGPEDVGIFIIILMGVIVHIFRNFDGFRSLIEKRSFMRNKDNLTGYSSLLLEDEGKTKSLGGSLFLKNKGKVKLVLSLILMVIFILTLQMVHYIFSEVIFFVLSYVIYDLLKGFKFKNLDMDFLFLSWFMAFFIFHSVYFLKDYRYLIVMAPAVAYFLMRGFKFVTSQLEVKANRNVVHYACSFLFIFLVIISAFSSLSGIEATNGDFKRINENAFSISIWLETYDQGYQSKVIYSDFWPYSGWYLHTSIKKMPIFRDNQALYGGAKNYNFTQQDITVYNHELDSNNADYYFSCRKGLNLTNFQPIKQFDDYILYERIK